MDWIHLAVGRVCGNSSIKGGEFLDWPSMQLASQEGFYSTEMVSKSTRRGPTFLEHPVLEFVLPNGQPSVIPPLFCRLSLCMLKACI